MSERATIAPTEFYNTRLGIKTYGVRVYDGYGQTYDNTWESIPDDDMDVLSKCMESEDDVIVAILDFLQEHGESIDIGGEVYQWAQVKYLWGLGEKPEEDDGESEGAV